MRDHGVLLSAGEPLPVGQSWAFIDHRSMAEIITEEEAQTG
jgi:hypothetical protein